MDLKNGVMPDPLFRFANSIFSHHVNVQNRLLIRWSPEQICHALIKEFPTELEMRVSPETIYQALYVQARGGLRLEVQTALRNGRTRRKPQTGGQVRRNRFVDPMVMIADRPPEIEDRAVPGHWEGDLITGAYNKSAIGTLVERTCRAVMLIHLPNNHGAEAVRDGLVATMSMLPAHLRGSLTWDQGVEMAFHKSFSVATDIDVFFCDPASPWQRGSNENTNGLWSGPRKLDVGGDRSCRSRPQHPAPQDTRLEDPSRSIQ